MASFADERRKRINTVFLRKEAIVYTPFTPLKVNYSMIDRSTLHYAGCFFFGLVEKNFGLIIQDVPFLNKNYMQMRKKHK